MSRPGVVHKAEQAADTHHAVLKTAEIKNMFVRKLRIIFKTAMQFSLFSLVGSSLHNI